MNSLSALTLGRLSVSGTGGVVGGRADITIKSESDIITFIADNESITTKQDERGITMSEDKKGITL